MTRLVTWSASASARRALLRLVVVVLVAFAACAAGCPFRQSDREASPGETPLEEVRLRVGESAQVAGGSLEVSLQALDYGNRIARLTLRLAASDGRSVEETIEAIRNARLSEAVRLEPYAVRVVDFPGVDSALLQVTREEPAEDGGG
ncbi:MAG TPA: hypothetical protein VFG78_02940 [Gemmatimonadota bacterium]|nr:hypothetical protein [Gemmatimonadota bacterium]